MCTSPVRLLCETSMIVIDGNGSDDCVCAADTAPLARRRRGPPRGILAERKPRDHRHERGGVLGVWVGGARWTREDTRGCVVNAARSADAHARRRDDHHRQVRGSSHLSAKQIVVEVQLFQRRRQLVQRRGTSELVGAQVQHLQRRRQLVQRRGTSELVYLYQGAPRYFAEKGHWDTSHCPLPPLSMLADCVFTRYPAVTNTSLHNFEAGCVKALGAARRVDANVPSSQPRACVCDITPRGMQRVSILRPGTIGACYQGQRSAGAWQYNSSMVAVPPTCTKPTPTQDMYKRDTNTGHVQKGTPTQRQLCPLPQPPT
jgi:hypothetical protein